MCNKTAPKYSNCSSFTEAAAWLIHRITDRYFVLIKMQKAAASALFLGILLSKASKLHRAAVGSSRLPEFPGRSSRIWWHTGNSCAADAVLGDRHCLQTHSAKGGINPISWEICTTGSCLPGMFFFFFFLQTESRS